jgi:hypothetical protein
LARAYGEFLGRIVVVSQHEFERYVDACSQLVELFKQLVAFELVNELVTFELR